VVGMLSFAVGELVERVSLADPEWRGEVEHSAAT
jgi:hypothetical protein